MSSVRTCNTLTDLTYRAWSHIEQAKAKDLGSESSSSSVAALASLVEL